MDCPANFVWREVVQDDAYEDSIGGVTSGHGEWTCDATQPPAPPLCEDLDPRVSPRQKNSAAAAAAESQARAGTPPNVPPGKEVANQAAHAADQG